MPETKNYEVARKPEDFYGLLAHQYILKYISLEKQSNSDLQTEKGIYMIHKERLGFTIGLMRLKHILMNHVYELGLLSGRFPDPTIVKQVSILHHHFGGIYLKLVEHLNCFKLKSSKRSRLGEQIELKLNEAVERLTRFQKIAEDERTVFVYEESSCYESKVRSCSAYINYLHVLLGVLEEETSDYVRKLQQERTVWQKVWEWFTTCGGMNIRNDGNLQYN